jgi:hypothetical protein
MRLNCKFWWDIILISYMIYVRELIWKFGICPHKYILIDDKSYCRTFDYFLYKCLNSNHYDFIILDLQFVQQEREQIESSLCLSQVLHDLPSNNPDATMTEISPHLYFICLLHLANEHGMTLRDWPTLDKLIYTYHLRHLWSSLDAILGYHHLALDVFAMYYVIYVMMILLLPKWW